MVRRAFFAVTDLARRGEGTFGYAEIDDLVFNFITGTNQLSSITEGTTINHVFNGFQSQTNGGTQTVTYDDNGNMTNDNHRDAAYTYNHLNLPERVDLNGGTEWVTYTYTASGEKLERHDHTGTTRTYCRGVEYAGASIDVIYQAEGRAVPDAGGYAYEYVLRDHLARLGFAEGNGRVWFTDQNGDNEVTEAEIIQQNHYYPFGMEQEGSWNQGSDAYRYNDAHKKSGRRQSPSALCLVRFSIEAKLFFLR